MSSDQKHGVRFKGRILSTTALWLIATISPLSLKSAIAQQSAAPQSDQLEEVIVTANRQGAQNVQNVPMAISVVNPVTMESLGMTGLSDISRLVPGLSSTYNAPGETSYQIRGLATTSVNVTSVADRSLVAVYYDDTPISINSANPDLKVFDLERVEVLKGPQGTLYGAGAMAGTIRFISQKPKLDGFFGTAESVLSDTPEGTGGINYSLRGMINVPIATDKAAVRAVFYKGYDSGFINNLGIHQPGANDYDTNQARVALRLTPIDDLTIDASWTFENFVAGGLNTGFRSSSNNVPGPYCPQCGPGQIPDYTYYSLEPLYNKDYFNLPAVSVAYDLDGARITSSTSYVYHRTNQLSNNDSIPATDTKKAFGPTPGVLQIWNKIHDLIEEARVQSTEPDNKFKWTVGIFYELLARKEVQDDPNTNFDAIIAAFNNLPGYTSLKDGAFSNNDSFSGWQNVNENQIALYGEGTYTVLPGLDLTVGLRYYDWRQKFSLYFGGNHGASPAETAASHPAVGTPLRVVGGAAAKGINPRFAASFHVDDDVMLFAEAAKGFRYGGVNQPAPTVQCAPALAQMGLSQVPIEFGPDKLWQYSVGEKSSLFGNRVNFNVDAFFINWNDVQTTQSLQPSCAYFYTVNKGKVTSKGGEFEINAKVTPQLTVSLTGAYTYAFADGAIPNISVLNGQQAPFFPRYQATIAGSYVVPLENGDDIRIDGNWSYKGKSYSSFNKTTAGELPSSLELDLSANYERPDWEIGVFGTNITNTYKIQAINPNISAAQTSLPSILGRSTTYARPQTVGVRGKMKF